MNHWTTLCPRPSAGMRICANRYLRRLGAVLVTAAFLLGALAASGPAHAVDGCKVLLCLAAPNWRAIAECVPTINQLNRDLALGKPFPVCAMAGAGNSASNAWANAPANCPPQYTQVFDAESGKVYSCDYAGAITVTINGATFTRTWWRAGGETVTEFSAAAKAQLGNWDTKFDDDYTVWLLTLPPPAPPADLGY